MSLKIKNKEDKVYIILGAPKSATSLISNGLIKQGIFMGEGAEDNMSRENRELAVLNAEILKTAGGVMVKPPTEESILKQNFTDRIKAYIKKNKRKRWGLKDPRMSLVSKLYLPHLTGDVYLFCCFRKPEKVKNSYKGKISIDKVNVINRSIINTVKEFCGLEGE